MTLAAQLREALLRRVGRAPRARPAPPWPRGGGAVADDGPISIFAAPDLAGFDEAEYLHCNPDVAAAVAAGAFPNGRAHFELCGPGYGHRVRAPDAPKRIRRARARKLERLRPLLRGAALRVDEDHVVDALDAGSRARFGITDTDNVSSHAYPADLVRLIEDLRDGLILDCGAGSRDVYHPNVVNLDVARLPSTDILAAAEALPFADDAFDAVVALAVLEHVKFPFEAAREITRVLKPGGTLYVVVPFLQPLHGYPSHYFNMTEHGLRTLFEGEIEVERRFVDGSMEPIWAMHMIAQSWFAGLPEAARASFLSLSVGDLLRHPAFHAGAPYVTALSEAARFEAAAATGLVGRKKTRAKPA